MSQYCHEWFLIQRCTTCLKQEHTHLLGLGVSTEPILKCSTGTPAQRWTTCLKQVRFFPYPWFCARGDLGLQTVFGAAQHDMPHSTTCHAAQTSISKCTLHTCPDSVEQPAPACTYCCETPASKACHNAIVSFQQTQTLSLTEKEECIMSQIHYLQFACAKKA